MRTAKTSSSISTLRLLSQSAGQAVAVVVATEVTVGVAVGMSVGVRDGRVGDDVQVARGVSGVEVAVFVQLRWRVT